MKANDEKDQTSKTYLDHLRRRAQQLQVAEHSCFDELMHATKHKTFAQLDHVPISEVLKAVECALRRHGVST